MPHRLPSPTREQGDGREAGDDVDNTPGKKQLVILQDEPFTYHDYHSLGSLEDRAVVQQVGFVPENDPPSANQYHIGEAASVGAVIGRNASWITKDDLVQGA